MLRKIFMLLFMQMGILTVCAQSVRKLGSIHRTTCCICIYKKNRT